MTVQSVSAVAFDVRMQMPVRDVPWVPQAQLYTAASAVALQPTQILCTGASTTENTNACSVPNQKCCWLPLQIMLGLLCLHVMTSSVPNACACQAHRSGLQILLNQHADSFHVLLIIGNLASGLN